MEDLISNVFLDYSFPGSYKLSYSYKACILNDRRVPTKFDINYFQSIAKPLDSFDKKKLLLSKLNLNPLYELELYEARTHKEVRFIRFRSTVVISNTFIGETFMSRGIYPDTYYDYDTYFNHSQFNYLFMEFMLKADSKKSK